MNKSFVKEFHIIYDDCIKKGKLYNYQTIHNVYNIIINLIYYKIKYCIYILCIYFRIKRLLHIFFCLIKERVNKNYNLIKIINHFSQILII